MARPSGRPAVLPNEISTGVHPSVPGRVARETADRRARCVTLLTFNGFAVRLSRSAIFFISDFLATMWPLIEIRRSLVVYVNHHNKDYIRKTPCDWLCGDDGDLSHYFDLLFLKQLIHSV